MKLNRRVFLGTGAAAAASLSTPAVFAAGAGKPRVVVVGGGAGGATAARYIANDSKGAVDVTLIEPSRTYFTCFFSNLYLGGIKQIDDLGHNYGTLAGKYGINVVHDWAVDVDRSAKTVSLAGGAKLPYDKLILSPGIDFVDGAVEGWDLSAQNAMPHAYKGGSQTELLKSKIMNMPEGGVFAMVAHALKASNPTAKIIVADPKGKFSKMALFQEGWANHYDGMIDWIGSDFGGGNVSVDPDAMTVTIDGEVTKVDACNVIPAMNNSQAKVCANAVRGALTGSKVFPAKFSNTCWSLIDTNDGVKVGATYEATDEKIAKVDGFISATGESSEIRKGTYEESEGWYTGITTDMFG